MANPLNPNPNALTQAIDANKSLPTSNINNPTPTLVSKSATMAPVAAAKPIASAPVAPPPPPAPTAQTDAQKQQAWEAAGNTGVAPFNASMAGYTAPPAADGTAGTGTVGDKTNASTAGPDTTQSGTGDINKKIDAALTSGLTDAQDIATAAGTDVATVNSAIAGDENLAYKQKKSIDANESQKAYNNYQDSITKILNGTFELSDDEKASLKSTQDTFDQLKKQQMEADAATYASVQTDMIRGGGQEFANTQSTWALAATAAKSVQNIADLESKSVKAISDLKTAIADKKYKQVTDLYNALDKHLTARTKEIDDLHQATVDAAKAQQDAINKDLQNQKLKQDIATNTIEGLTPSLVGADDATLAEVAKYYGIDSNLLKGSVQANVKKQDADMIAKGYRIINPVDVEAMRKAGNDVQTLSGRAYMKEPDLKSFTNKGNITFYKGMKKVGQDTLAGGSGSGTSTDTKAIDAFNKDVQDIRQNVYGGTWDRESAIKYFQDQYDLTPENAASLISE